MRHAVSAAMKAITAAVIAILNVNISIRPLAQQLGIGGLLAARCPSFHGASTSVGINEGRRICRFRRVEAVTQSTIFACPGWTWTSPMPPIIVAVASFPVAYGIL